ncbi:hypothetical protein LZ32DRAFT_656596 [Colletotrichum eremochloae]|nr:hypothetical protein LZ32DRAFT_656596 [Colletotrichum eremochloae]
MFPKTLVTLVLAAASALATPLSVRQSAPPPTSFAPSATFTYNTRNGAIYPSNYGGVISKSSSNEGNDLTALLTFTYPQAAAGKKCQLWFLLDGPTSGVSGSRKLDVFASSRPAPAGGSPGWGAGGPGNQRDANLGRWSVPAAGGWATWDATYGAYLTAPTDCKAPGTVEGFELVGVYDNDYVSWNAQLSGARIAYF